jgi:hypothetical protein
MTRLEVMVMLSEGGLKAKFDDTDKGYEITEGDLPGAYLVPQWLYDALTILQEGKPKWRGKQLDPWAKDEIRGQ